MSKDNQDKIIEQKFWDLQSTKSKYLTFDQKVYSAFRINEYALRLKGLITIILLILEVKFLISDVVLEYRQLFYLNSAIVH